jgi:hypothetical protein
MPMRARPISPPASPRPRVRSTTAPTRSPRT